MRQTLLFSCDACHDSITTSVGFLDCFSCLVNDGRAKAEKAAAAEAAHIGTDMETNMEEAERFVLPSGIEVEAAGRGPPDLALISRRIKETVRLLDGFKVSPDQF